MSLYVMGDLHLSHFTEKPMDIFGSEWINHTEKIKENWPLNQNDTIILNGDFSWAMKLEQADADFNFLNSLKGRKILLKGNHDYWWNTLSKLKLFTSKYSSINFLYNNAYEDEKYYICGTRGWIFEQGHDADVKISEREAGRLKISLDSYKKTNSSKPPIVFLHYPPVFGTQKSDNIISTLHSYNVKRCYYGHLHGQYAHKNAYIGDYEGIDMQLTSCDYLDFKPLMIE